MYKMAKVLRCSDMGGSTIRGRTGERFKYNKGGNKMKKLFFATLLLALAIVVPIPTMAGVNIGVGISLPPPIVFSAQPNVIAMPDTDGVYVLPDVDAEIFFSGGCGGA